MAYSDVVPGGLGPIPQTTAVGKFAERTGLIRAYNKFQQSSQVKNLKGWGWAGVKDTLKQGARSSIGIGKGGFAGWGAMGRAGLAGGIGYAAYALTDNPMIGLGIGAATAMGTGGLKNAMNLLEPISMGISAIEGFRNNGIGGAAVGVGKSWLGFRAWDLGLAAAKVAFKGTAIGAAGGIIKSLAMGPVGLTMAGLAGIGYGAYRGSKYMAQLGRDSRRAKFAGNMDAFMTEGAWTMRQRALQEINRSHTNARTILGQEASYMHVAP